MKKLAFLLTTALTALSFTSFTAAYAEEQATSYPDLASNLSFTSLSTYAVNEDMTSFAFAEGNYIYLFDVTTAFGNTYSGTLENNGAYLYYYEHTANISDIAFSGDNIVFTDGSASYKISDGKAASCDYTDYGTTSWITLSDSLALNVTGGSMNIYEGSNSVTLNDAAYSSLKQINGNIYVVRDNTLCVVTGSTYSEITVTPLTFEYVDLTQGAEISVGDAASVLTALHTEAAYVTLPAGTYVTNTDLTDLGGEYFAVGDGGTYALTADTAMLYLGTTSGGVDILACGSEVYLTAGGNTVTAIVAESYTAANAYMNTSSKVYSMPYMAEATAIDSIERETVVTVNGIYTSDLLQCSFAYITYTDGNGNSITGYVASNFITEYYFAAEDGEYEEAEYTDEYSEDNVILTVCLILVIVVLIIAGVAYIAYSSATDKRKERQDKTNEN
ncbi:MAG: hypothetical protein LUI60_02895 [Clostridia bacterium]|nr:hypothetical protein [Clostridia bacterium]